MDYSKIVDIKHRVENYRAGAALLDHRGVLSLVDDLWTIIGELLVEIGALNATKWFPDDETFEKMLALQKKALDALAKELGIDTE